MTEEKIKKLLIIRYRGTALGYSMFFVIAGIALLLFGLPHFAIGSFVMGFLFWLNITVTNHNDIKNIDNALLFKMYPDREVLIKVMDEVLCHPIYISYSTNISEHFILYGDEYENIIRLCDVIALNKTKLNDKYSEIHIEDRFKQRKKVKVNNNKVDEIYQYLSDNCKNAEIGKYIDFESKDCAGHFIDIEDSLTEEYCFYESTSQKTMSTKNRKEKVKTEKVSVPQKEEVKEIKEKNNKSSNMEQKYNDLKKLKELLDNDIITQNDYDKEKAKILSD